MSFPIVVASIEVGNSFLPKLPRVLMTTVLEFCLPIFDFCLKTLANRHFFFMIFSILFKKPSRFSIEPLFKMRFRVISCCCLASDIFLVSSIGLGGIRNKKVLKYI